MRGRKPIPAALKAADASGRKLPTAEPKPPVGRPAKPKHLTGAASAAWDDLVDATEGLGVLAVTDRAALTLCAELIGIARDAYEVVKRDGMTMTYPNGAYGPTPHWNVYVKATAQAKAFLTEFGLTPSARPRVKVPAPEGDPADFSDL